MRCFMKLTTSAKMTRKEPWRITSPRWPSPGRTLRACIVGVDGVVHEIGVTDCEFSIQSVSKPFIFALVCEALEKKPPVTSSG